MNVNEISNSSAELIYKIAHETVDVILENNSLEDENCSIASSESNSVNATNFPSNTVIVKNSSDVHIGDRTYLTIQHTIPDSEIVEQIIKKVIVSSKCRNVLNVEKVDDQLGTTYDASLENWDNLTRDCAAFSSTQNGTKEIKKETSSKHQENHWLNRGFTFCGHPFTVKFSIIFVLVLLVSTTACILTILKFTAERMSTPPPQYIQPTPPIVRPTATQPYGTSDSSLPTVTHPKEWYLITRKDWNAHEVAYQAVYLHHPVKIVIIAHTAGGFCLKEVECLDKIRGIQAWSVGNNNFDDIPYNFLVGGDGNAFEGLGWDIAGAHTRSYNSKSIGIAFIGNFVYIHPTPQQFEALKRLLAWGVQIGKLDPDYRLVPHNLTHATLSPGRFVYEEIKHWPHFTEDRFQIQS